LEFGSLKTREAAQCSKNVFPSNSFPRGVEAAFAKIQASLSPSKFIFSQAFGAKYIAISTVLSPVTGRI
jgi:hypothetical protein